MPEHTCRIGSFVGAEMLTNRSRRTRGGIEHVLSAEHVRLPRLAGMQLEQRHVLEGGGVEDHLWPMLREDSRSRLDRGCRPRRAGAVEQGPALDR